MHSNPNVSSCPAFLPGTAQRSWAALDRSTESADATFDPDSIGMLPAPVIRWLRHTIAPGTPLSAGVQVSMHGEIRIKKWLPFTAQQIVSPTGYIWAAEAGKFPMNFRGYDRYSDDTGHMSWKLYGHIPLVNATGSDIDRSAAGRLASEVIGLTPAVGKTGQRTIPIAHVRSDLRRRILHRGLHPLATLQRRMVARHTQMGTG